MSTEKMVNSKVQLLKDFNPNKPTKLSFAVLSLMMCWNRIKRSELGTDNDLLSLSEMKQETVLKIIRAETSFMRESGLRNFFHDSGFFKEGKFYDELLECKNPKIMESLHLFLKVLLEKFDEMVESEDKSFQTEKKEIIDKIRNDFLVTTVQAKHKLADDLVELFNLRKPNSEVNWLFSSIFMFLFYDNHYTRIIENSKGKPFYIIFFCKTSD